jgi:YidC/Oxa1 family membrane protein insertase
MTIILKPFALLLGWLYAITGSYGLAIILFGLIFKILLFPISIRGRKGMLDMSRLSERQKELQQKYGSDRQRYSIELQNLYASENVKPSGGCVWSLAPVPILMALYFILSQPFTHLLGLTNKVGGELEQLTAFLGQEMGKTAAMTQLSIAQQVYDRFDEVRVALPEIAAKIVAHGGPIDFTFFGINLSKIPDMGFFTRGVALNWGDMGLFLIPIFSAIVALGSMIITTYINRRVLGTHNTAQDSTTRSMYIVQPLISLWLGFTLPAALGLYWAANSIFAILQEFCSVGLLKKHVKKMKAESEARALLQKEKEKEQKKQAAEQKRQKAEEARRIKMERRVSTDGISESRVGMRAYAKGRTFDRDRYPITPYHDPDDIIREKREAAKAQTTESEAQPTQSTGKKKRKEFAQEELPKGMTLNEAVSAAPEQEQIFAPSEESTGLEESAQQKED